ncbi:SIMPL domain-containing protein [Natranaerobius trueperi]|uniref:SIMPL domain-containing protein n=1 Tax=Natranaerobius trueperi TaxID=759412 RepID=A0A226BZQ4_9FIRM|nr:SIMPL domain-containing protein [Natranaerobius trueperi]OWZ84425.1 hypothetical protein CDO51_02660 [Natranaerobius trueperi]
MLSKKSRPNLTMGVVMAIGLMLAFSPVTSYAIEEEVLDLNGETSIVTVKGEGIVEVEPDLAYLTLGVETSSESVRNAQEENIDKMELVVDTLHDIGLDEQDIKVGQYSIGQQYVHPEDDEDPEYEVSNQIDVTVTDLEQVGPILEAGVEKGVNNVISLEYGVESEKEYELKALDKAMEKAKNKAKRIAAFYKKSLGDARQVNEGSTSIGYTEIDFSSDRSVALEEAEMDAYGTAGLAAEPGEVTFDASVDVLYKIE